MSEESSRRHEVSANTVTFLKSVSQNKPDCISAHMHFKKYRWAFPRPPSETRGLRLVGTPLPNDKS